MWVDESVCRLFFQCCYKFEDFQCKNLGKVWTLWYLSYPRFGFLHVTEEVLALWFRRAAGGHPPLGWAEKGQRCMAPGTERSFLASPASPTSRSPLITSTCAVCLHSRAVQGQGVGLAHRMHAGLEDWAGVRGARVRMRRLTKCKLRLFSSWESLKVGILLWYIMPQT